MALLITELKCFNQTAYGILFILFMYIIIVDYSGFDDLKGSAIIVDTIIIDKYVNRSHLYKPSIKISIVSRCSDTDGVLAQIQRASWLRYLNDSECIFAYNYAIGNCEFHNNTHDHHDVIKINVEEGWDNLQHKTLSLIDYEHTHFEFDFLLKTDTDSYVNIPKLCHFLTDNMEKHKWISNKHGLYMGYIWSQRAREIILDVTNKYGNAEWSKRVGIDHYTHFMAGFGYILSRKTTQIISTFYHHFKGDIHFNRLEDTYLGHLLTVFNVSFINITHLIDPFVESKPINYVDFTKYLIEHPYKDNSKHAMIQKYNNHITALRQDYY
eukprot:562532_1